MGEIRPLFIPSSGQTENIGKEILFAMRDLNMGPGVRRLVIELEMVSTY